MELLNCGYRDLESSQPNYEEWKHPSNNALSIFIKCSQPNYEEWKQRRKTTFPSLLIRSQPNYEEWKQFNVVILIT